MSKILIAYSTRQGGTQEVAEAVGDVLSSNGSEVDVVSVDQAPNPAGYDAVVVGVPLYTGRFLKTGDRFLRKNEASLGGRPWALFVLGPRGDDKSREDAQGQLDRLMAKRAKLDPRSIALFDGVIRPEKLRFPFNRMAAGDWRDWDAIRAWAQTLPSRLSA
jgi:menaquinone-dependent protoporphyrinogen oxidase